MSDARESKLSVLFYNPCKSEFCFIRGVCIQKRVTKNKSEPSSEVKMELTNCLKFVEFQIMVYCFCRPSVFVQEFSVVYTGNGKWTHFSE